MSWRLLGEIKKREKKGGGRDVTAFPQLLIGRCEAAG